MVMQPGLATESQCGDASADASVEFHQGVGVDRTPECTDHAVGRPTGVASRASTLVIYPTVDSSMLVPCRFAGWATGDHC